MRVAIYRLASSALVCIGELFKLGADNNTYTFILEINA